MRGAVNYLAHMSECHLVLSYRGCAFYLRLTPVRAVPAAHGPRLHSYYEIHHLMTNSVGSESPVMRMLSVNSGS